MWQKVLYQVQPLDLGLSSLQNPDPNQPLLSLIYLEYDLLSSPQKTDKITGTSVQTVRMGTEMRVPEPVFACPSLSLKQCPSPLWVCVSIALLTNDPQLSWKYPPSIIQRSCIEQGANVSLARCFQFQAWLGQQPWFQRVWRTFHTVAGSHSLRPSLCRLLFLMELLHILPPSQSFYSRGGLYSIISFTF